MVDNTRAGFATIIGSPNAGKSTLLNKLVGEKVSIVSPKTQTTRMRITGVLTEDNTQVALIDTPGIFSPKRRLDKAMVEAAWDSLEAADVVVLLVDAAARDDKTTNVIAELQLRKQHVTLALNKTDKLNPNKLLPIAAKLNDTGLVDDIFMISALTGDGIEDFKKHLLGKMPRSPLLFPEDELSDLPSQLLAAEITREQLYRQLQQELPYAATVVPESWETKKDGSIVIHQKILVSRAGYKPIVLGKGGARIKSIGAAARMELTQLMDAPVHLFLDVKVDEKWQDRPELYKLFGLNHKI
jgi:GTPase